MTVSSETEPEPLLPLRLSWPKSAAVESLCRSRGAAFELACDTLHKRGVGSSSLTPKTAGKDVAMSLANSYLSLLIEQRKSPGDLERFLDDAPALQKDEWLCDLFLAAGCIQSDDAASRELLRLIQGEVAKSLRSRVDRGIAEEVRDDLMSHLLMPVKQGFNRGRPRIAMFGGQSGLLTWLKTVAHNRAIDYHDKRREESLIDGHDPAAKNAVAESSASLTSEIRTSLRSAVGKLLRQLVALKAAQPASVQLEFFVLRIVEGLAPKVTAQRLAVVPSRVTELADAVCKRLTDLLVEDSERWSLLRDRMRDKNDPDALSLRKWLEQWVQTLFFGDDASPEAGAP